MIVHFLWVDNHNGIKNTGINLGPTLEFEYISGENLVKGKERPKTLPLEFWKSAQTVQGSEIVNVSCLVGKNGTGKSSILNLLRDLLNSTIPNKSTPPFILILEVSGNQVVNRNGLFLQYYGIASPKCELAGSRPMKIIDADRKDYNRDIPAGPDIIYYTNIFDFSESSGNPRLHNISTNYLIQQDAERLINSKQHSYSELELFRVGELERLITFILEDGNKRLPFDLPNGVYVQIFSPNLYLFRTKLNDNLNRVDQYAAQNRDDAQLLLNLLDEVLKLAEIGSNENDKESFMTVMAMVALCGYLHDREATTGNAGINMKLKAVPKDWSVLEKIKWYIGELSPNPKDDDPIYGIQQLLRILEEGIVNQGDKEKNAMVTTNSYTLRIHLNSMHEFLKVYQVAVQRTKFFRFSWRGLSSGQQSILTMYARFHSIPKSRYIGGWNLRKHFVVLIDEGTEYFHPDWQREFVKYLLDFLPYVYGNDRSFQIILTANSPLVVSDFPREHIHLLGKKSEKEELGQTFGANIHKLFSNAMFLKSTIGAFAERKINTLIKFLNGVEGTDLNMESAQQYIDLIGEPILQKELQRMLNDKREDEDPGWIATEIARLQKKLDKNGGQG